MELMYLIFFLIVAYLFLIKREKFLPVYGYLTGANDRLYKLLSDMQAVFEKNGVKYAITGDILLSAVEKEKLTRGQTTGVVLIAQEDVDELLASNGDFAKLGLGLTDLKDGGYRLSSGVSLPTFTDTAILLFPIVQAGERWITSSKYQGYNEWYGADELFPGKKYKLGLLDINGPSDPVPYLQRNYWSLGLHAIDGNKRWFQLPQKIYKTKKIPVPIIMPISNIDYVNGIRIDPRPIPGGKKTVILGNGRTAVVPDVGANRVNPRRGRWRRFLWT